MTTNIQYSDDAQHLIRKLARDIHMFQDLTNRMNRRNAIVRISEELSARCHLIKPKASEPTQTEVTQDLATLMSAPSSSSSSISIVPPLTVLTSTFVDASVTEGCSYTPEQQQQIVALEQFMLAASNNCEIATYPHSFLQTLLQRMSDEMEAVRTHSVTLALLLSRTFGSSTSLPLFSSFIPLIYHRLFPTNTLSASSGHVSASTPIGVTTVTTLSSHSSPSSTPAHTSAIAHQAAQIVENAEELRLKLLQLLISLIENQRSLLLSGPSSSPSSSAVDTYIDSIISVLTRTINDPFPDIKKLSCQAFIIIVDYLKSPYCQLSSTQVQQFLSSLVKSLLPNLKHNHSLVRVTCVQALGALLRHPAFPSDILLDIFPTLSSLVFDRTPKLREIYVSQIYSWMMSGERDMTVLLQGKYILLLLGLVADEVESVQKLAIEAINNIGEHMETQSQLKASSSSSSSCDMMIDDASPLPSSSSMDTTPSSTPSSDSWLSADLASPFACRPPDAARRYLTSLLPHILPSILQELTDWTVKQRLRSSTLLKALLIYVEQSIVPHITAILNILVRSIRDEEIVIHQQLCSVCEILGFFIQPISIWLEWILQQINSNADTNYRASTLIVLLNMIHGLNTQSTTATPASNDLQAIFPSLIQTLSNSELCCHEEFMVRVHVQQIIANMILKMSSLCSQQSYAQQLFHILLQLDSKAMPNSDEEQQILLTVGLLGECENSSSSMCDSTFLTTPPSTASIASVYSRHFLSELRTLLGDAYVSNPSSIQATPVQQWETTLTTDRLVFFKLLTRSLDSIEEHISLLLPILIHCAQPTKDESIRVHVLTVLYTMVLQGQIKHLEDGIIGQFITEMLVPNCVWRSGRVASALRLHALTAIHAFFVKDLISSSLLSQIFMNIIPIAKSNMDDDEPQARIICVLIVREIAVRIKERIEDETLTDVHRELIKRLDDSNDDIRLEAIASFSDLFHNCFPPADDYDKTDSYFRYILSSFFVYLDDSNPAIREAVFTYLKASIPYNVNIFIQEAEIAARKHTSNQACALLSKYAIEYQQSQQ